MSKTFFNESMDVLATKVCFMRANRLKKTSSIERVH